MISPPLTTLLNAPPPLLPPPKRTKKTQFQISVLLTTLVEIFPRSMHEFCTVNLVFPFREDVETLTPICFYVNEKEEETSLRSIHGVWGVNLFCTLR